MLVVFGNYLALSVQQSRLREKPENLLIITYLPIWRIEKTEIVSDSLGVQHAQGGGRFAFDHLKPFFNL